MLLLSVSTLVGVTIPVYAQTQKTSKDYIENARSLLKQVSIEYKNGNYTKAEDLSATAYLENFEHVEADLQKRNQTALVGELEKMIVSDLRGMIKNRVSQDQLDAEIAAIDAKLAQAYVIVPEFPIGIAVPVMIVLVIGGVIALTRLRGKSELLPKY